MVNAWGFVLRCFISLQSTRLLSLSQVGRSIKRVSKRACAPAVQVDQRRESCEESVPFKTTSSPSFALSEILGRSTCFSAPGFHAAIFSRSFLLRHARLTKRKTRSLVLLACLLSIKTYIKAKVQKPYLILCLILCYVPPLYHALLRAV